MSHMSVDINGSWIKVKNVEYKKSTPENEENFHDCYVTFLDGEVQRFDAQDITVLNEGE